eukprot:GFUD01036129.1.p1 GENE.GFUD01036129.1~~GFUD01036129.1.p1  ORF type:complete len:295 (+),score=69.41 GFUD01036129.1:117-1001(+)
MFAVEREAFCSDQKLDEKWQNLAKTLIYENIDEKEDLLKEFKEKIASNIELVKLAESDFVKDDAFLIRYLRGANWRVPNAVELIKASYVQVQDFFPFMSAGPPSALDHVWDKNLVNIPLERDQHGRRVFIFRLGEWCPQEITTKQFFTAAFTLFELIALEEKTQVAGVTVVADIAGFGLKHLKYLGLDELRCLCNFLTGAFPLWFRKIHIINNPRLFNMFLTLCKPFVNERVRENLIMHNYDLTSLHSEVPPALLPSYLGGEQLLAVSDCVEAAKERDSYFSERIELAKALYDG